MEHLTAVLREIVFVWHWLLRAVPWRYKRQVSIKPIWVNRAHYLALWNHSIKGHCAFIVTVSIYGIKIFLGHCFCLYDFKLQFSCSQHTLFSKRVKVIFRGRPIIGLADYRRRYWVFLRLSISAICKTDLPIINFYLFIFLCKQTCYLQVTLFIGE